MPKVDLICDLQFGSTGKGLLAGFLSCHPSMGYSAAVSANMPNAGHTFIQDDDKWIFKVLPIAAVAPSVTDVFLGPGCVFAPARLVEEWLQVPNYKNKRLWIHEGAMMLRIDHAEKEQQSLNSVSSTMQGSCMPMIEKIMRNGTCNPTVRNVGIEIPESKIKVLKDYAYVYELRKHEQILVEGSQGYSLGVNAGFWPYCTSRDCTPARIFADCGVPIQWLHRVWGTLRSYPIRVGNTAGGTSGPVYPDQHEITWQELGIEPEYTTVTKRVRRVFTFSWEQFGDAWHVCRPDFLFVNFVNYLSTDVRDHFLKRVLDKHTKWGGRYVEGMQVGIGPSFNDVKYWSPYK